MLVPWLRAARLLAPFTPRLTLLCTLLGALSASAQEDGAPPPGEGGRLNVAAQATLHQLSWRDAEDVLEGAILPLDPRVGRPLTVSVRVGTLQGAPFDGPVSLTIRATDEPTRQTQVVQRDGERWVAQFTPRTPGPHQLTVSFRTTRHKVLHGGFTVKAAPVSRAWSIGLGAGVVVLAVAVGAFRLLRRKREDGN